MRVRKTQADLEGINVLVTRPETQHAAFCKQLQSIGAQVTLLPTIEIRKLIDPAAKAILKRALHALPQYRWLLFTSVNAVDIFFNALLSEGMDARTLGATYLGVIGERTAKRLKRYGLRADLCPENFRAEGLLQALLTADRTALENGAHVLLPRAKVARDILPVKLRELGAKVDEIAIYETIASRANVAAVAQSLRQGRIHCLTFTSSSTVTFFFQKFSEYDMGSLLKGVTLACIGPITADTLKAHGYAAQIIAPVFTTKELARAIAEHFRERNGERVGVHG